MSNTHTHTQKTTKKNTHARTHTSTHARTHARTHTHTHTHTHTPTPTPTHTYTHTHTHARANRKFMFGTQTSIYHSSDLNCLLRFTNCLMVFSHSLNTIYDIAGDSHVSIDSRVWSTLFFSGYTRKTRRPLFVLLMIYVRCVIRYAALKRQHSLCFFCGDIHPPAYVLMTATLLLLFLPLVGYCAYRQNTGSLIVYE